MTDAIRAHEGGEGKWPPGRIFPFCPGAARSGRNQGAKHQAAPLACASGETGPTWFRAEAAEGGTESRADASRSLRKRVGPALPGAHAGEFPRQALSGRRGGKRVEARAASRNPESLTGRSPGRFGRPVGRPRQTVGMACCCSAFVFDYLCGVLLVVLLLRLLLRQ